MLGSPFEEADDKHCEAYPHGKLCYLKDNEHQVCNEPWKVGMGMVMEEKEGEQVDQAQSHHDQPALPHFWHALHSPAA
jgi:hypothetical protein